MAGQEDAAAVGEPGLAGNKQEGNTMVADDPNPKERAGSETRHSTALSKSGSSGAGERAWYAIHTYSGYENKVKSHLEARIASMNMRDKIFRVVVPMEEEVEIKQGQRRTVQRKVFPGYVLVEMILTEESWYVVRNTPGVTSFVGSGTRPVPLQEHEVRAILKQVSEEAEKPKTKVSFTKGQSVRVIDGPFTDFIGTVSDINMDRNKVTVLVSFFGRETPVVLDFLQVEKI
ncbi:transcription termination/antitermination protein NusG [Thermogemmatispora onikobensis]|uniref:transcription termination/antitermination protein NusG n=1 Tax=Thermogemmatispora onikobensis TaxID=732234 RepID=UPI000A70C3B6|nr:transcription termination/antitermination protein NusG [Thermogemmatispora onikobensis]